MFGGGGRGRDGEDDCLVQSHIPCELHWEMAGEPSDSPMCRYSERSEEMELVTVGWADEEDAEKIQHYLPTIIHRSYYLRTFTYGSYYLRTFTHESLVPTNYDHNNYIHNIKNIIII